MARGTVLDMDISGFHTRTVQVHRDDLRIATAGAGPPVLLLHGFPQSHLAWRRVAPILAEQFEVVCPDLPGYGESAIPSRGSGPERFAKRTTAATMVELMVQLGHEEFAVVGHDRGGLVAFRAALDHPERVTHLVSLGVIPQVEMWEALHGAGGVFAFHLYLLAGPAGLPEQLIGADPDIFFGHFLDSWISHPAALDAEVRESYLSSLRTQRVIHAICEDYRAGAFIDPGHDTADRVARRRIRAPTLAMWEDPGEVALPFDPAEVWAGWAPDLHTRVLPGGHFLPEDLPEEVATAIGELVRQ